MATAAQVRLPGWARWTWLAPATFLAVFLGLPILALARQVAAGAGEALAKPVIWQIAGLAAAQALASAALALAVGLPMAAVIARYRFPGQRFVQALVTVPFVLPTVVVALAFRSLLGADGPSGLAVVIVAHAYLNLAVVVRVVGTQWAQLDDRPTQVARSLGATPLRAFVTVTVPALRPAILVATAVVFAYSFTSLGIVLVLGDGVRTLESFILRQTAVLLDFPGAAAAALVQSIVVATALVIAARIGSRTPAQRRATSTLRALPQRRAARIGIAAVAITSAVIVLTPITALVATSLRSSGGWTLQWWTSMGSVDAGTSRIGSPLDSLTLSVGYALATGLIAAILGGLAAISLLGHRLGRIVALLAVIPLGVSSATLGLGTLLAFGRPPLDLRGSGLLVPLAHALVAVPLVIAVAAPSLRSTDPRSLVVAQSLGATTNRAFWTGYGPVLRVVMLAAGGLAAAVSLGELGAASFLARATNPTVPLQITRLLSRPGEQSLGVAAALSVVLVVTTIAIVMSVDRWGTPRPMRTAASAR